jgi:small subunit ribosomal protein S8
MSMNDPISDMLTRIRNATRAGHDVVSMPSSNLKMRIAEILKSSGYIRAFRLKKSGPMQELKIGLRYDDDRNSVITNLRRISKPGLRKYIGYQELRPVRNGQGLAIVSTSKGVLTDWQAKEQKVGGEVICEIW